jgi:lysylphosphatidylglycerol synthetase-like protein (DUF2156 family)
MIKPQRQGWSLLSPGEELSNDEEDGPAKRKHPSLLGPIALGVLAVLGCAMQFVLPGKASRLHPAVALPLLSWVLLLLLVILKRPRYCQRSLLLFYLVAFVTEAAKPNSWSSATPNTIRIATYGTMLSAMISILVVLCMQLYPAQYPTRLIRTYGIGPSSKERSPEDSLRLWQYLTFSWVWPLLAVGKERQIDPQDVWARAYELRNEHVAKIRSKLGDLPLLRRLLKENAVDSVILVVLSLVSLSFGKNRAVAHKFPLSS